MSTTPIISNLESSNAIRITPKNNNKRPFGFTKLAEPDILSKGFILLLFVITLIIYFEISKNDY